MHALINVTYLTETVSYRICMIRYGKLALIKACFYSLYIKLEL